MKISGKLFTASLIPLLLLTLGSISSLWVLKNSSDSVQRFVDDTFHRQVIISEIYGNLGYGKGIHAFKNYVIRGDDQYFDTALKTLTEAKNLIQQYIAIPDITEEEKIECHELLVTVENYLQRLPLVKTLNENHLPIAQIDRMVRVDDHLAIDALERFNLQLEIHRNNQIQNLQKSRHLALMILASVFFLSIVFAIIFTQALSSQMVRSIKGVMKISSQITAGTYDIKSDDVSKFPDDELRSLAKQMIAMAKNLEISFNQMKKSNEDLEQFSFIASHDLQEPVKKIFSFTDMLDLQYGQHFDANAKSYVAKIKNASTQMIDLIQSLLNFAHVANTEFEMGEVSLQHIVAKKVEDLEEEIKKSRAHIMINNLPSVIGNADMLSVVIHNLLCNGIKFAKHSHPPEIHIFAQSVSASRTRIVIQDKGIGFDMKYVQTVLKPFGRAHSKKIYPGSGIGLAVCKRILAAHGSDLEVESKIDEGSSFSFILGKSSNPEPKATEPT